jgi:hypothetical protein
MATSEVPNTIRVPVELSHVLAAGKTITITPKRADVTVAVASAGAAAVSASGTAVTLTCKSDDSTTVTAMLALIAASASVDALLAISGTGTDTFNHLLTRPATPLYMDLTGLLATIFGRTVGGLNVPFLLDDDGQLTIKTTVADAVQSLPYLPATPGATPTVQQGTTGRLNADLSYNIAAGKGIIFHPLQHGVSVSVASGGAAAVLATGRAVVFTEKSDDTTTLTAMLALLAASNAAGLVAIQLGTAVGGDTWNHLLTLADTALYASGTIPANLMCGLYPDGYNWPLEVDATGGLKTSAASLAYGEGDTVPQLRVQEARTFGTALVATGTGVAVPCRLRCLSVTGLTVAGSVGIRDGGAGGTLRFTVPVTADGVIELGSGTFGTDVHITFVVPLAATVLPLYAPLT